MYWNEKKLMNNFMNSLDNAYNVLESRVGKILELRESGKMTNDEIYDNLQR
jgi:hypothetical protein